MLRGSVSTLGGRVAKAIGSIAAVLVYFIWFFKREVQISLTKSVLAALHGTEASLVSMAGLVSFRSAFASAAWSSTMPMAKNAALLSLHLRPTWVRLCILCLYGQYFA